MEARTEVGVFAEAPRLLLTDSLYPPRSLYQTYAPSFRPAASREHQRADINRGLIVLIRFHRCATRFLIRGDAKRIFRQTLYPVPTEILTSHYLL